MSGAESEPTVEQTVEAQHKGRLRAVKKVLKQWRSQLIDVSGANRLLYYRDLKVAVVDLEGVAAGARAELLSGAEVRASRLWPDKATLERHVRSLKAIAKPARVYAEEFGLQITYIASGFATWDKGENNRAVRAPVLLRLLHLRAVPGSADGFVLQLAEDLQINPVLLHLLEADHRLVVDEADLLEAAATDEEVFERLSKICSEELDGFEVERRSVIANFAYASQSMVADLSDEQAAFLAEHDMIAALAGDAVASDTVRSQGTPVAIDEPDHCSPSDEHLILDADGSQSYVINAINRGQHLVVQGPPGTGKTQTITNAVAELVAQGKRVLFVAQKRAAITAVLDRLQAANLDRVVLDLFDGANSRKAVVQELGRTLESAGSTGRPRVDSLHAAYAGARGLLVTHRRAMHEVRQPWGMALLGSKDLDQREAIDGFYDWAFWCANQETSVRFDLNRLQTWSEQTHEELRGVTVELFDLGGLDRDLLDAPGWRYAGLPTNEDVRSAEDVIDQLLSVRLAGATETLRQVFGEFGPQPAQLSLTWCTQFLTLLKQIEQAHAAGLGALLDPEQFPDALLDDLLLATGSKSERKSADHKLGMRQRRQLRKHAASALAAVGDQDVHQALESARGVRTAWRQTLSLPLPASVSPSWASAREQLLLLADTLARLEPAVQGLDLDNLSELQAALRQLMSDRSRSRMPRINDLRAVLENSGVGPVVAELLEDRELASGEEAANRLSYAFARTVIEWLDRTDERLAGYSSTDLDRATADLIAADEELRNANASRVRRAAAEKLVATLDANPAQHEMLRGQVKRKRGFKPVRELIDSAAEVILAAKPVWAASPQVVSQLLPNKVLFDVVLFDEASQVLPASALPAIARGRQVVVAGDDLQLPPTTLFTRTAELEGDESLNLDAFEDGDLGDVSEPSAEIPDTESILDAIAVKLGTQRSRHLAWHYRSRDERLIATSNAFLYRPRGRLMTTFPAADAAQALRLDQCPPSTGLGKTNLSPAAEVKHVVDLMLEHAATECGSEQPRSLGVIAFGVKHAARIEREFEERLEAAPADIQEFFRDEGRERYFIKNIERVQGDERDVIILTVGYGRGTSGKLSYNWGPVLTEGGFRRVNVAITRARSQMIVVTSFAPDDVDKQASTSEGFQLMYRFLHFAGSAGTDFGDEGPMDVPMNVFEADIQKRLEGRGLSVVPQYGVGGYRLDFAVQHPDDPARYVLAVEADGASYHSGLIARERDRLRQRQLEARGWRFVRIWSSDYFFDPDAQIERVVSAYEEELAATSSRRLRRRVEASPSVTTIEARDAKAAPAWTESISARQGWPGVRRGLKIQDYTDTELQRVVIWVLSDERPRTRAEIFEVTKSELGFLRSGKVITERINRAIEAVLR